MKIWKIMFYMALSACMVAAQSPSSPAMDKASELFAAKDWAGAADAFARIASSDPSTGLAWMRLGVSRHKLGQYEQAIAAYRHIETDPRLGPSALYREAASFARLNNKDEALGRLDQAVTAGLGAPNVFRDDADLALLRGDSAFEKIIERADALATPCAHAPEHRQFDFWLGEWAVEISKLGQKAGDSSIQSILGRCILLENWTGAGGGNGKSFNHYDSQRKLWIQDWVDDHGGSIHFEGKLEDGVMSYYADSLDPDGSAVKRRLQFFKLDDNHVRQFSQRSKDGGRTWTPEYDFVYVRKK